MNLIKKISIVLLCFMVLGICIPEEVFAADPIGGELLNPVMSFLVGIADGAYTVLQKIVFNIPDSLINIDSGWSNLWEKLATVIIVLGIVASVALMLIPGLQAGGLALATGIAKSVLVLTIAGFASPLVFSATTTITRGMLASDFQLPLFSISSKEIFSNEVHALDVDFFNPMEDKISTKTEINGENVDGFLGILKDIDGTHFTELDIDDKYNGFSDIGNGLPSSTEGYGLVKKEEVLYCFRKYVTGFPSVWVAGHDRVPREELDELSNYSIINNYSYLWKFNNNKSFDDLIIYLNKNNKSIYMIIYTKKMGFVNNNHIKKYVYTPTGDMKTRIENILEESKTTITTTSTAKTLRPVVSKWYNILRNLAIVALLSILVYIGIRIVISSTSNDKAKYKQMIVDWVVAICLIFVMQYIMSFSNIVVDKVIDIIKSVNTVKENINITDGSKIPADLEKELKANSRELFKIEDTEKVKMAYKDLVKESGFAEREDNNYAKYFRQEDGQVATDESNVATLYWPTDNELSQSRIKLQLLYNEEETWESMGWKLIYIILVIFTFVFLYTYAKRVLYMAFLTIIAPFVAMTYPIDKIHDGKAQAFNMWLKEYIFNLLIQPMHLILYTVLIGSAMDLATNNIIYVACALGFMMPAEKLMRRFFGFEKAQTPGLLSGAAGAGLMMTGLNKLLSKAPNEKGGSSDNSKEAESEDNQYKPRKNIFEDMNGESNNDGQGVNLEENQDENEDENSQQDNVPTTDGNQESDENSQQDEQIESPVENPDENPVVEQNNNEAPQNKSVIRGISRAGEKYVKGLGRKFVKKANNTHLHLGRKTAGLALGLTAGTAGAILGVATGDASNVFKYAAGAGLAGNKAGKGIGSRVGNALSVEGIGKTFDEHYLGEDEYRKRQQEKLVEKKQKDETLKWKLEDKLPEKGDAKAFMDQMPQIMEYGDFDNDTLVAMSQMWSNNGKNQEALNNAIFAAGLRQHYFDGKSYELSGEKKKSEFEKDIERIGKQRGLSGSALKAYCANSLNAIRELDGYTE